MPATTVPSAQIRDGSIVNADIASGAQIDASKLADGSVSNAELQRLDGVTSNVQTQFDTRVKLDPPTSASNAIKPTGTAITSLTLDAGSFAIPGSIPVFRVRSNAGADTFVITESNGGSAYSSQIDVYRTTSFRLNDGCPLVLEDTDGSHAISVAVPNLTANYTLTLPAAVGSAGQFLTTTGSGTLAFTSHGAAGDPHPQYIAKVPTVPDTNLITPDADVEGLHIFANNGNTGPITMFQVVNRAGGLMFAVNDDATNPVVLIEGGATSTGFILGQGSRKWFVTFNATGSSGVFTFRFPNNGQGAAGQILSTDGAGNTTWVNPTAGVAGSDTQIMFNDGGSAFGGDAEFTWNKTTNVLTVGVAAVAGHVAIRNQGELRLYEANAGGSNIVAIRAPAAINSDFTLTLPATAGSSGQVLSTDGTGVLSWASNISSLNALTAASQTFAKADDTNVTLTIGSATSTHTFTMGWTGTLAVARGGTGANNKTTGFNNLSPLTTKGDIVLHDGTNSTRLPIGTTGQFLQTNGSATAAWASFSSVLHSSLGGLTGTDDHTQYVTNAPANGARNVISAAANAAGLTINANAGSTVSHSILTAAGLEVRAGNGGAVDRVDIIGCPLRLITGATLAFVSGGNTASFAVPGGGFSGSYTLAIPTSAGTSGQFLQTNGTNALAWANALGSLNGLTAVTQTFAKVDDTNVTLTIDSATSTHTYTVGWTGTLAIARGGTGASTKTAAYDALSPNTTKGDIEVHNGTNSVRLPVGTNTHVLTADSAQALGVKWSAVSTSSSFIDNEVPSGTIDGSNLVFTLANTPVAGSVHLYKAGLRQRSGSGNDYTISGTTITFEAGSAPQTGDNLIADYRI